MYFHYIVLIKLNHTDWSSNSTFTYLNTITNVFITSKSSFCYLSILINHNGREGNLCTRLSFLFKDNIMLMRIPKKSYYCAANILDFHIIISHRESKEASLVWDTAMQNKILRRGTQILSDFLRQRGKEAKKKWKTTFCRTNYSTKKSIHLQLTKHNREQIVL